MAQLILTPLSLCVTALLPIIDLQLNFRPQGELEHRSPKARYARTSRKGFIKQIAQIERRQARIRRIRAKLRKTGNVLHEDVARSPEAHHHIGKSQNFAENIHSFVRENKDDPAIQVMFSLS